MQNLYLAAIKSFEGFTARAEWDYAQHSNGFGTRARFPGEQIDRAEAERRFAAEIAEARTFVERHAAGWDEGTKAALTSLTFNAGTRWASDGLGEAVRRADIEAVRERFLTYTKAGGVDLPGLVRRRLAEVTWIGEGGATTPDPATAPTTAGQHATAATVVAAALDVVQPPADAAPLAHEPTSMRRVPEPDLAATASLSAVRLMLLTLDLQGLDFAQTERARDWTDERAADSAAEARRA
jgi:lysozyme